MHRTHALIILAAATLTPATSADPIRATHTRTLPKNINITAPDLIPRPFAIVPTATLLWTSLAGTEDAGLARHFESFCLEAHIPLERDAVHEFAPISLAGAGYTHTQQTQLARLWHAYREEARTIDTSAAFQIAIWEIVHDDGLDPTSGPFTVNSWGDARDTALAWLTAIAADPTPAPSLRFVVLHSPTSQNQLVLIPLPPAAGLALLPLVAMAARRRFRASPPTLTAT